MTPEKSNTDTATEAKQRAKKNLELGDSFFQKQDFVSAKEHYEAALKDIETDKDVASGFIERLKHQIKQCDPSAKKELSKPKENWLKRNFGGGGMAELGKSAMASIVKKFIPKIKSAIEKNRPKAIAFMRGELTLKFEPLPEGEMPQRRIVIIELVPDPSGDKSKDDIIIQIKKADLTKVQVARYPEGHEKAGQDASVVENFSGMGFIEEVLSSNLEAAIDEVDFGDTK